MKSDLCQRCGAQLPAGAERCPECLHKPVEVVFVPRRSAWWLALGLVPAVVIGVGLRLLWLEMERHDAEGVTPHRANATSAVRRSWQPGDAGLAHLHLVTEIEPFERAVRELKAELLEALPEVTDRPDAAAEVTLWLPAKFDAPGWRAETEDEVSQLDARLARSKRLTKRGAPVRVVFGFGAPRE